MNRHSVRSTAAAGLFALAATSAPADTLTVYVYDFDFSINPPGEPVVDAVVNVGDTVSWLFLDSGHSSTSVMGIPEVWNSGYIGIVGETYEHTFTHQGTWWYYCFPHGQDNGDGTASGMAGTVTVLPAPGSGVLLSAGLIGLRRRRRRAATPAAQAGPRPV